MPSMPILTIDPTSINALGFLFEGDDESVKTDCTGSIAVETETTTKAKTCGGQTIKEITKPTKMTITINAHVPIEIYRRVYGLAQDTAIKPGIYSYGKGSKGEKFAISAELVDDFEDTSKLIAFLKASSQNAFTFTIDSSEDEVSMVEIVATAYEDELGKWYHEALESELPEGLTKEKWLTNLKAEDLKK